MPAAAVTVAEGSEEGGCDSGGQGTSSRVRLAVAAVQGRARWRTGGGSGYGRRQRGLWKTRARLLLRWLGEEKI